MVTYNTLRGPNAGLDTVLTAIGEERVNGFAKPIDVLLLQEQDEPFTTTQAIVNQLNAIYGAGTYRRTTVVTGPSFSSLRQSLIYRADTVQLVEERVIGPGGTSPLPPRQALRTRLRPVGYDESADFYVYNNHFKAGSNSSDFDRRAAGARAMRDDADTLGANAHVIFGGDFNLRSSNDEAFQVLVEEGGSQAFDPADFPGQWKNNFGARSVHTHGRNDVDDRFDFLLPTNEWRDQEGLDILEGSYRAFGNNGSTYNQAVNSPRNTYDFDFGESPTHDRQTVLDALVTASDHLPVVADFQLPAVLSASIGEFQPTVALGDTLSVDVFIENAADVLTPLGADELDFSLAWSGSTNGSSSGFDLALGGPAELSLLLDTSIVGRQTTTLVVSTDSPSAAGGVFEFDLEYEVLAALPGDLNSDGRVDAADYTIWRDDEGILFDQEDYNEWAANFGTTAADTIQTPEPATLAMSALAAVVGFALRRRD